MSELMRIASNVQAQWSYQSMSKINAQMGMHKLRLASGKRINSNEEDANEADFHRAEHLLSILKKVSVILICSLFISPFTLLSQTKEAFDLMKNKTGRPSNEKVYVKRDIPKEASKYLPQRGDFKKVSKDVNRIEKNMLNNNASKSSKTSLAKSCNAMENGNTADLKISNPRVDGDYFKFEIQIRRTNTWESGVGENVLGNADFYFDRNAKAFAGSPIYENLHTDLTGNNYTCTAQVNVGKLQFKIEYSLQDLNFFKPALDVYNTVCTVVWEIADPTENTGVTWDQLNTGALSASNSAINLTYEGSGDITFPNAPVITALEDTIILEDDTLQIAPSATDVNGNSLTFSAASDTSSVNLSISDTTLTIIPEPNWNGLASIEVTVSNGELSDTTNFILTVQAVNDAPEIFLPVTPSDETNIILTSDNQNDTLIISWETANDVDGDTIIYSFFSEDTLSLLNIENTKETEIRLPYADIQAILDENSLLLMRGSWTIIASDGQDSTEASNGRFELTIETTLTRPVITALEDTIILEDDTPQIALSATDINGGSLIFSAASDTSSVNLSISDTTLTIIPEPNWNGLASIEVTVSNGELSDTTNFILTVQAVNDAPEIFLPVTPSDETNIILTSDNQNDTLIISWETANDVDGDTIIYSFFSEDTLSLLNIENTKETEIRLPYADIQAILDENSLLLMRGSWTIIASDGQDSTEASNGRFELTIETTLTGIDDENNLPKEFELHPNYPNPFNPVTTISYDLPKNSRVALVVYNILGQKVVKLVDHNQVAGRYTVQWNGQDTFGRRVSSGVYFYLIIADEFTKTRRMLLLK